MVCKLRVCWRYIFLAAVLPVWLNKVECQPMLLQVAKCEKLFMWKFQSSYRVMMVSRLLILWLTFCPRRSGVFPVVPHFWSTDSGPGHVLLCAFLDTYTSLFRALTSKKSKQKARKKERRQEIKQPEKQPEIQSALRLLICQKKQMKHNSFLWAPLKAGLTFSEPKSIFYWLFAQWFTLWTSQQGFSGNRKPAHTLGRHTIPDGNFFCNLQSKFFEKLFFATSEWPRILN